MQQTKFELETTPEPDSSQDSSEVGSTKSATTGWPCQSIDLFIRFTFQHIAVWSENIDSDSARRKSVKVLYQLLKASIHATGPDSQTQFK